MKSVCCNPAQSLASSICYPQLHKFSTRATTWGSEGIARISYIDVTKPLHTNFEYWDSGFVIHRDHPILVPALMGLYNVAVAGMVYLSVFVVLEIKTQIKLLV